MVNKLYHSIVSGLVFGVHVQSYQLLSNTCYINKNKKYIFRFSEKNSELKKFSSCKPTEITIFKGSI